MRATAEGAQTEALRSLHQVYVHFLSVERPEVLSEGLYKSGLSRVRTIELFLSSLNALEGPLPELI